MSPPELLFPIDRTLDSHPKSAKDMHGLPIAVGDSLASTVLRSDFPMPGTVTPSSGSFPCSPRFYPPTEGGVHHSHAPLHPSFFRLSLPLFFLP